MRYQEKAEEKINIIKWIEGKVSSGLANGSLTETKTENNSQNGMGMDGKQKWNLINDFLPYNDTNTTTVTRSE